MPTDRSNQQPLELRKPVSTDGFAVHELVRNCPPLDPNSMYCNLLQCSHFADTCVAACRDNQLLGFLSAYKIPSRPHVLFVWQVAVAKAARGRKLAGTMLAHLLQRPECADVTQLETTITDKNAASWKLFQRLASSLKTELHSEVMFGQRDHFCGQHDSEVLVAIGPFDSKAKAAL